MKKIFLSLLILNIYFDIDAQLLSLQKEYYIKFGNGKVLSCQPYNVNTPAEQKSTVNTPGINPVNIKPGLAKTSTLLMSDSLLFEDYKPNDKKQVWIIDYYTELNTITGVDKKFDFSGDISPATNYFTIRNKATGKYITATEKEFRSNNYQVLLSPLSQNGQDVKQHWNINTADDQLRGTAAIFLGRASVFGISPQFSRTDAYQNYLAHKEPAGNFPGLYLANIPGGLQKYDYSMSLEPATKAEKIQLNDIGGFCPKTLLRGDRDFATGERRNLLNQVTEENHKMGMDISVELTKTADGMQIWAKVYFVAEELGGDGTKTEGTWNFKVYQAIPGRTIRDFLSVPVAHHHFETSMNERTYKIDHKYTCDIINYYSLTGDTMGDDVSTDDNCNDDTRIDKIAFNPVYVFFNN